MIGTVVLLVSGVSAAETDGFGTTRSDVAQTKARRAFARLMEASYS
jgi:hypothetical protein